jgi:hypothetical protein
MKDEDLSPTEIVDLVSLGQAISEAHSQFGGPAALARACKNRLEITS